MPFVTVRAAVLVVRMLPVVITLPFDTCCLAFVNHRAVRGAVNRPVCSLTVLVMTHYGVHYPLTRDLMTVMT